VKGVVDGERKKAKKNLSGPGGIPEIKRGRGGQLRKEKKRAEHGGRMSVGEKSLRGV